MSLHIGMTDEANAELRKGKIRNYLTAISTAALTTILGGLLLYTVVIVVASPEVPEVVAYVTSDQDGPPQDNPVTPERVTTRPSASVQNHASVITSSNMSDVAIQSVDIETPDVSDLGQSLDLGVDFGTGVGEDLGMDGGGFGTDTTGGSSLQGTLYDFKQSPTRKQLKQDLSYAEHTDIVYRFMRSGWKESVLSSKYYKAPKKLYNSHIFISHRSADDAPRAYGCADTVKPKHWAAIYRGKIVAPKSGKFRFVGMADDIIAVRFNGEDVYENGYFFMSLKGRYMNPDDYKALAGEVDNPAFLREARRSYLWKKLPAKFYKYSTMASYNARSNGMIVGPEFSVTANEVYPIEILVSEVPGEAFSAFLLIEEVGAKYEKDPATGDPILPLFRTNYATPLKEFDTGTRPPYDPMGLVWPCVK